MAASVPKHLTMSENMNHGTRITYEGFIAQYRHLPGATKKNYLSFKPINGEPEENELIFCHKSPTRNLSIHLRQFEDDVIPEKSYYVGHMTTATNSRVEYSGVLNSSHTFVV